VLLARRRVLNEGTSSEAPVPSRKGRRERVGLMRRLGAMPHLAWRMAVHDRLKSLAIVFGVLFATLLVCQQAGVFLGLLHKNTMYVTEAGADLWIVPAATETFQPGPSLRASTLPTARAVHGVGWADEVYLTGGNMTLPNGGAEPVTLIGARRPRFRGGPWNLVAGSADALRSPDTISFEDADRERFGGIDLGSIREINGQRVRIGALTWGLIPFGPPYVFGDYDLIQRLVRGDGRPTHVLVGGVAPERMLAIQDALQRRLPDTKVLTSAEMRRMVTHYILSRTAIGQTLGTSALFALLVGFVIVAVTMFSGVVERSREFGTLKAMGVGNQELTALVLLQATLFAAVGVTLGIAAALGAAELIRSARLALVLPPWLFAAVVFVMLCMCWGASLLALRRLYRIEPGMVFR
jgi:putative ABC transport system permease protein